jgi:hypothetical protein
MTDAPEVDAPEFPRDAKPWLDMLSEAETRDASYHDRCDKIDKLYACLERSSLNDRELQVFWANLQVLGPTIYSREPVPVVAPRFRDRKPIPRRAGEILERALISDAESDHLHDELLQVRDELARLARGVIRVSLVTDRQGLRAKSDHIFRRDFRHGGARKWKEVPWVAWRGYYTREEYKARFKEHPPEGLAFKDHRKQSETDAEKAFTDKKAAVWEIWHEGQDKVIFVGEGAKVVSEAIDPPWKLDGFWPLVPPAYGTLKPESLTPIPDVVYYQDQLDEINELTGRIAALTEGLRVKGFYNSGQELGSAIEAALADSDNRTIMVPVAANLGPNASMKDAIHWMPLEVIAATIQQCVELRKQLMQDVYEISGLSDIMRGETEAQETLGAQQLKADFGSRRVKERQAAMQRVARDVFRLKAEIMAEQMPIERLLEMSQVDDLPRQAEIEQQTMALQQRAQGVAQQAQQAMQQAMASGDQQGGQAAQQQAQEAMGPLQQQMQELQQTVTVEAVAQLFQDQRLRPFVLEVETDSTIEPDQMAEKQNRIEFLTAMGGMMMQGMSAMQLAGKAAPEFGEFFAESIRFAASGFKVQRSMDDAIDKLAEGLARFEPPPPPGQEGEDPQAAQAMAQAEMMKAQAAGTLAQAKAQEAQGNVARLQSEMQIKQQEAQIEGQKTGVEIEKLKAEIVKINAEVGLKQQQVQIDAAQAQVEMQRGAAEDARAERGFEREGEAQERQFEEERRRGDQQHALAKQTAATKAKGPK